MQQRSGLNALEYSPRADLKTALAGDESHLLNFGQAHDMAAAFAPIENIEDQVRSTGHRQRFLAVFIQQVERFVN